MPSISKKIKGIAKQARRRVKSLHSSSPPVDGPAEPPFPLLFRHLIVSMRPPGRSGSPRNAERNANLRKPPSAWEAAKVRRWEHGNLEAWQEAVPATIRIGEKLGSRVFSTERGDPTGVLPKTKDEALKKSHPEQFRVEIPPARP
jgi:hypothetical protein